MSEYYAKLPFIDGKRRRIAASSIIPPDQYSEQTIKHYLAHEMIAEGKPTEPEPIKHQSKKQKRQAKPEETK